MNESHDLSEVPPGKAGWCPDRTHAPESPGRGGVSRRIPHR